VELSASLQVRWVKFVVVAQRLGEKFAAGGYRLPRVLRDWTCVQREARVMVVSRMYPLVIGSLVLSVASSVAQEKKIKRSDLPAAVEKTVSAQSQRATIRGFSEERENGQMYYEAEMTVDGHSKDLLVDNSLVVGLADTITEFDPVGNSSRSERTRGWRLRSVR